jgi:hypothetical protein
MYVDEAILNSQKEGVIVCVPKKRQPEIPDDYRALPLPNADFKILSRILANRLKKWKKELLNPSQTCGIADNNIYGALAAIRETIAQVEMTNSPTCLLTLDFTEAFDKISHTYIFKVLEHCGLSPTFLARLKKMYTNVTSSVQVSGHIPLPFEIRSGIRQGCPLSMLLFTLCINPLLCMLDTTLHEINHNAGRGTLNVVAYAYDVTFILRSPNDIPKILDALACYEAATAARLNIKNQR